MVPRLFFRKLSHGGNHTWTSIVRSVDESLFFFAKTDFAVDTKDPAEVGNEKVMEAVDNMWNTPKMPGEISSDLYGLSGCDILNLTFCRLDFHQLLIKIS